MPIEQRVISSQKIGAKNPGTIGAAPAKEAPAAEATEPKKSRRRLVLVLVAALVVVAAAAYYFLGRGAADPGVEPPPEPGVVLPVDAISLNLADGHYLRIGLGLQLTADVGEEKPDTSKAVDLAIALFSGRTVAEVSDPATREQLKAQLLTELTDAYEGEVMDVYLTDYVTQ
ncbi:flagellar basal body-associated FliL family protein [Cellulomonas hominis]